MKEHNYQKFTHLILGVVNKNELKLWRLLKKTGYETEEVQIIEMRPFNIEK